MERGFYFAMDIYEDEVGFGLAIVYHKGNNDFQINFTFLDMVFAIGYTF